MKAYAIVPAFDLSAPEGAQVQACITLIATIVCDHLRRGGDCFHYTVDWRDHAGAPWQGWNADIAEPHVVPLGDEDELLKLVRLSVDPFAEQGAVVIRSIATCRAVTFGWDGQAYLCLRHEDEEPTSPNATLVEVRENAALLVETDFFDGWLTSR